MAYVEIRKEGRLVARRPVDDQQARKGCKIRMGSAGAVHLTLGQSKTVGKYQVTLFDGELADDGERVVEALSVETEPGATETEEIPAGPDAPAQGAPRGHRCPVIEGYEVIGRIGQGGMGTVWKARELSTKREVAIKFLASQRFMADKSRARFEREVALAAKLTHPNIARVYASGLHRGVYYYVMELVNGVHLDQYVKVHNLNAREILELMYRVADAVRHAHGLGIIHRDLKPSNILVSEDGQPHVVDFGLAKTTSKEDYDLTISVEGEITGTPAYMAPEQAAGRHEQISERTDVYSLGVILYHLLTGHLPHSMKGGRYDVLKRIIEEEVRDPCQYTETIDQELEALILTALAKDPDLRYPSAAVLAQDLDNYLKGEPLYARSMSAVYRFKKRVGKHVRPMLAAGLVIAIVVTTVAMAYWWVSSERSKRLAAEGAAELRLANVTTKAVPAQAPEEPTPAQQDAQALSSQPSDPVLQAQAPEESTPARQDAQAPSSQPSDPVLQAKWLKALRPSSQVLGGSGDLESQALVDEIIRSLEQPGGASYQALAGYARRMEDAIHSLVRRGSLESGAEVEWAMWQARHQPGRGVDGPASNAQNRSSGRPGPDGLVLHLSFDEESPDGTVRDASGAGNNGRVVGAKWVTAGRKGGAYEFSIRNLTDCVTIPDSDTLDTEHVTVAAWVKTSDKDGFWNRIIDKDFRKGYSLSVGGDWNGKATRGKLVFELNSRGINSDSPIGDGNWHHVAGTFDGRVQKLYVDGVEQKEKNDKHKGPIPRNNWDLTVGNSLVDYGTGEFLAFDGLIDEVMIFNRALTAPEIQDLSRRSAASSTSPASIGRPSGSQAGNNSTPTILSAEELKRREDGWRGSFAGIGVELTSTLQGARLDKVFTGGPAEKAGLQVGQLIAAVDDKSTQGMSLEQVVDLIRGPEGSSVRLDLQLPTGQRRTVDVVRGSVITSGVETSVLDQRVGLVRVTAFNEQTVDAVRDALKGFSGQGLSSVILDLRSNQGGLLNSAAEVAGLFVPSGQTLWFRRPVDKAPQPMRSKGQGVTNIPLAVLIDKETTGSSELLAAALKRNHRATLVGRTTSGGAEVKQLVKQPDGSAVLVKVGTFDIEPGQPITGKGIEPDVSVPADASPDEILQKALQILHTPARYTGSAGSPQETAAPGRNWFADARFGLFIHWGLYSIPAQGEMSVKDLSREDRERLASQFRPARFDANEWVGLAKEAGMRYITLVTKHAEGFCLFDSKLTSFDSVDQAAHKDFVAEMVKAAHAAGLHIVLYYSMLDWYHPGYKTGIAEYVDYMHGQIRELCTDYGPIDGVWFDSDFNRVARVWRSDELVEMIRSLQPSALINDRLGKDRHQSYQSDFFVYEQKVPDEPPTRDGLIHPWELAAPIGTTWGYKSNDSTLKSAAEIVRLLVDAASKGGNLLLNIGPMATGQIPDEFASRLRAVGQWMRVNGASIYGTAASPIGTLPFGRCTAKDNLLYLHVFEPSEQIAFAGVRDPVTSAALLRDGRKLDLRQDGDRITITLPKEYCDPIDTVVTLELGRQPAQ